MELATIPQNSSAMSTGAANSPQQHQKQQHNRINEGGNNQRRMDAGSERVVHATRAVSSDSRLDESGQQQSARRRRHDSKDSLKMVEEQALKYGASHVIHLFVPVSLCMGVVIMTMLTVGYYSKEGEYLPYTPFHGKQTDGIDQILLQSLANAGVLLSVIVVMTILLIALYKARCYRVIHGWLMLSSLMLLSIFTLSYIEELFRNYNIPVDYITLALFLWNWCVLGMICIHWTGPLLLQQFYLVAVSALMALTFIKHLPEWSVWSILAVLSIWDLVAVLCPKGPLRILVETAQKREEPIFPALIYSSGVLYMYTIYATIATAGGSEGEENAAITNEDFDEERGDVQQQQQQNHQQQQASTSHANNNIISSARCVRSTRDGSATSTDGLLQEQSGDSDKALVRKVEEEEKDGVEKEKGMITAESKSESTSKNLTTSSAQLEAPGRRSRRGRPTNSDDTLITIIGGNGGAHHLTSRSQRSRSPRRTHSAQNLGDRANADGGDVVEERGVKLGLGDFIFYSVLVGKASSYGDWNVTIACYVSILVGLAFTLMLLALFRKALPALPISIFAGITFFFGAKWLITPFTKNIALRQLIL